MMSEEINTSYFDITEPPIANDEADKIVSINLPDDSLENKSLLQEELSLPAPVELVTPRFYPTVRGRPRGRRRGRGRPSWRATKRGNYAASYSRNDTVDQQSYSPYNFSSYSLTDKLPEAEANCLTSQTKNYSTEIADDIVTENDKLNFILKEEKLEDSDKIQNNQQQVSGPFDFTEELDMVGKSGGEKKKLLDVMSHQFNTGDGPQRNQGEKSFHSPRRGRRGSRYGPGRPPKRKIEHDIVPPEKKLYGTMRPNVNPITQALKRVRKERVEESDTSVLTPLNIENLDTPEHNSGSEKDSVDDGNNFIELDLDDNIYDTTKRSSAGRPRKRISTGRGRTASPYTDGSLSVDDPATSFLRGARGAKRGRGRSRGGVGSPALMIDSPQSESSGESLGGKLRGRHRNPAFDDYILDDTNKRVRSEAANAGRRGRKKVMIEKSLEDTPGNSDMDENSEEGNLEKGDHQIKEEEYEELPLVDTSNGVEFSSALSGGAMRIKKKKKHFKGLKYSFGKKKKKPKLKSHIQGLLDNSQETESLASEDVDGDSFDSSSQEMSHGQALLSGDLDPYDPSVEFDDSHSEKSIPLSLRQQREAYQNKERDIAGDEDEEYEDDDNQEENNLTYSQEEEETSEGRNWSLYAQDGEESDDDDDEVPEENVVENEDNAEGREDLSYEEEEGAPGDNEYQLEESFEAEEGGAPKDEFNHEVLDQSYDTVEQEYDDVSDDEQGNESLDQGYEDDPEDQYENHEAGDVDDQYQEYEEQEEHVKLDSSHEELHDKSEIASAEEEDQMGLDEEELDGEHEDLEEIQNESGEPDEEETQMEQENDHEELEEEHSGELDDEHQETEQEHEEPEQEHEEFEQEHEEFEQEHEEFEQEHEESEQEHEESEREHELEHELKEMGLEHEVLPEQEEQNEIEQNLESEQEHDESEQEHNESEQEHNESEQEHDESEQEHEEIEHEHNEMELEQDDQQEHEAVPKHKVVQDHEESDPDHEETEPDHEETELDHEEIESDHEEIEPDHEEIEPDHDEMDQEQKEIEQEPDVDPEQEDKIDQEDDDTVKENEEIEVEHKEVGQDNAIINHKQVEIKSEDEESKCGELEVNLEHDEIKEKDKYTGKKENEEVIGEKKNIKEALIVKIKHRSLLVKDNSETMVNRDVLENPDDSNNENKDLAIKKRQGQKRTLEEEAAALDGVRKSKRLSRVGGQPLAIGVPSNLIDKKENYEDSNVAAPQYMNVLCHCRVKKNPRAVNLSGDIYCQAIDSFDGRMIGCGNIISNDRYLRVSGKIPYMLLCTIHRQRVRRHNCCPGCGLFCTQGVFSECRWDKLGSRHYYHKLCGLLISGVALCPHCGTDQPSQEVHLELKLSRKPIICLKQQQESKGSFEVSARMSTNQNLVCEPPIFVPVDQEVPSLEINGKIISPSKLPIPMDKNKLISSINAIKTGKSMNIKPAPKGIYWSCKQGDLEKLLHVLAKGVNPNARVREYGNQMGLHVAANHNCIEAVHILVSAGASMDLLESQLQTPLMLAIVKHHNEIVQYLVQAGASLDIKTSDCMTCLHLAAKSGNFEACRHILDSGRLTRHAINVQDEGGWTPLVWASENRCINVVKILLDRGANPQICDVEQNTALHWAAFSGSTHICSMVIDRGCSLRSMNAIGDTPLHIAARQNHVEAVVLLLARGASLDIKNAKGQTPLDCAFPESDVLYQLTLNKELRSVSVDSCIKNERILSSDIAAGKETVPIPCVNGEDDDGIPKDYVYISENCEAINVSINRTITSLKYCECEDGCNSENCICSQLNFQCWYDPDGKLLIDFNYADPPMIFECNRACSCNKLSCQNRVVQHGMTSHLQLVRTDGKGWGVRALKEIPKGSYVCEYVGEIITDLEADQREDDSYLFDLDNRDNETYCIDARQYGNVARFINHLCEPNLTPVKIFIDHQDLIFPRIAFFANRDIEADEELGFDYGEKFWVIKYKQFTCRCGSMRCKYSAEKIHATLENYNRKLQELNSSSEKQSGVL